MIVLYLYLAIIITYLLIFSIAGRLRKKINYEPSINKKRIAICIASYKEDEVIINTARAAAEHNYPTTHFDVFIAADHVDPSTINRLQQLPVHVYPLNFERSSKARSLNYLLNTINEDNYDIALVLDGDNIMADGFLEKINTAFNNGARCVQAHRTAKNKNTPIATLDAISEEINNNWFRSGPRAFGLSSALIGSGMAFEFKKLKEIYSKPGILDNPACDREVDFEMMKADINIEYINSADVFDEKVSKSKVFEKQRRRWFESQLIHLKLFFSQNEHVSHKTKNYWNKLFINLVPPRIILLLLLIISFIGSYKWGTILTSGYIISMLLSVPSRLYTIHTLKSVFYVPVIIFTYLRALIGLKPSRKEFVHTPKTFK